MSFFTRPNFLQAVGIIFSAEGALFIFSPKLGDSLFGFKADESNKASRALSRVYGANLFVIPQLFQLFQLFAFAFHALTVQLVAWYFDLLHWSQASLQRKPDSRCTDCRVGRVKYLPRFVLLRFVRAADQQRFVLGKLCDQGCAEDPRQRSSVLRKHRKHCCVCRTWRLVRLLPQVMLMRVVHQTCRCARLNALE
jgi:hypothetical protein